MVRVIFQTLTEKEKSKKYALNISGFYQNLINKLRKNYYVHLFLFDFYRHTMSFLSFSLQKSCHFSMTSLSSIITLYLHSFFVSCLSQIKN